MMVTTDLSGKDMLSNLDHILSASDAASSIIFFHPFKETRLRLLSFQHSFLSSFAQEQQTRTNRSRKAATGRLGEQIFLFKFIFLQPLDP
jgi:hypothetical protein